MRARRPGSTGERSAPERWIVAGTVLLFFFAGSSRAGPEEDGSPASVQVPVLLKVLTFDKTLGDRPGDDLRIVVVEQPGDERSSRIATDVAGELGRYDGQRIQGRLIRAERRPVDLLLDKGDPGVEVLYLTPGLERLLPNVLDWSRRNRAISFTGAPALGEKGVAVWIGETAGKPRIQINLVQLRSEGRELDARLLGLATVRR